MTLKKEASNCKQASIKFLRDLISLSSTSTNEKHVANRMIKEMNKLGFYKAFSDDYGNVIGQIGTGPVKIVFDGHIDTVDVGNEKNWPYDPFRGKIENGFIYGRGACDNKNANVVQVYGAYIFKKLYPELLNKISIYVVGSIQEEDCDGLGLKFALQKSINNVNYVCLGESTNLNIYRGHRGRMEIKVSVIGKSCHGSTPDRGDNAIYKMTKLISDIKMLNKQLINDDFLGKGTCAVTFIKCETPSLCSIPDKCSIHIDRRLTTGENKNIAIQQIMNLNSFNKKTMKVEILKYDTPSYKNKIIKTEKYYPTWILNEDHPLVQAGICAAKEILDKKPIISRWIFSTNGVSSMGKLNIPTIGFGPGMEEDAHTVNDRVKIDDLIYAIAFYANLPTKILKIK